MATGESSLTPSMNVGRIREPMFRTVKRGYDPTEVLEYLGRVADRVEALESRGGQLESELLEARRQSDKVLQDQSLTSSDPYEAVSTRVADLVRTFDHDVDKLRVEAEAEVDRMLAEARIEAERIRLDSQSKADEAHARAERALRDAGTKADEVLSALGSRREALLGELRAMRLRMLDSVRGLETMIEEAASDGVLVLEDSARDEAPDPTSTMSAEEGAEPRT
jgi:DivIVA domain-containing protein